MATNLDLDTKLIDQALRMGHHKTKREAVNTALRKYVQWLGQQRIIELFGTIDFDPNYDYKAERLRGRRRIPR